MATHDLFTQDPGPRPGEETMVLLQSNSDNI